MWLTFPVREHGRNPAFLLPAGIHFRHSLSWGGARVHHLTGLGWSGLSLCRSCAYCNHPCEFIRASDLLCLEDIVHLSHLSPLAPFSYSSENDEPKGGTVQNVLGPPISIINQEQALQEVPAVKSSGGNYSVKSSPSHTALVKSTINNRTPQHTEHHLHGSISVLCCC